MGKPDYERPRNVNLAFRVSEKERALIEQRMAQAGMKNMRAFVVKQALEGRIIHIELDSVRDMVRLLSDATGAISQIAGRVTETGNIHTADLQVLRLQYESLWAHTREILQRLSKL